MMALYTKLDMFGFADFYNRWSETGLSMDEMLDNYKRYQSKPRDIFEPIKPPGQEKVVTYNPKPPNKKMRELLAMACQLMEVKEAAVNSKDRHREIVTVRQLVAYVGRQMGYEPADFSRILNWNRTLIYAQTNKAKQYAATEKEFRQKIDFLLDKFGCDKYND